VLSKYLNHFPDNYSPSTQQVKLIEKVESAFGRGKKYVIACAPTGSGKSFLSKTLSGLGQKPTQEFTNLIKSYNAYKQDYTGSYTSEAECLAQPPFGTFVLTITKSLQDQYLSLFPDTNILKGKTNYTCDVDPNFDVETAPCLSVSSLKDDCCKQNRCPYYNARNTALLSPFAALNYKMFMALPSHIKHKNFIICDEASELEEELVTRFSAEINYERLKNYNIPHKVLTTESYEKARAWICELLEGVNEKINALTATVGKKPKGYTQSEKIKLIYLKNLASALLMVDTLWSDCEFTIDKDSKKAVFTPLKIDRLTKHIFDYGDKILLMSATIIDHKNFAKNLGITDYEYVEVESEFSADKSPIHVTSKNKLNYKNYKVILPDIALQIKAIAEHHKTDKGIIHTHSLEITNILRDKLNSNKRFLFRDETSTNESILKEHHGTDLPTILVSPSLCYGVDLKDDLARFQIIVKLPFPPLSVKRVKKLFDSDKDWYENKMLNTLVQACGRATRSKNDFSTTYILDGNIVNTLKRSRAKLPQSFIDRVV